LWGVVLCDCHVKKVFKSIIILLDFLRDTLQNIKYKDMRINYKKLYKIGEVMRYSGLSRQTIHNYTKMGLLPYEERTDSGHRLYPEEVFRIIEKIEMLKRHRTLEEVKKSLNSLLRNCKKIGD
jgi:predicted DNA-binding transcriptional regulator AlpA